MKTIQGLAALDASVVVLGMFDGVHRGHQKLLSIARSMAEAHRLPLVVCTFEPHPLELLCPDRAPKRLTTVPEREALMAEHGVDVLCQCPFTHAVAATKPEDFIHTLTEALHPKYIVCGFNFTFGDRGSGTPVTLERLSVPLGFSQITVPEVILEGETVSSTRIRRLLETGSLTQANRLLGHHYTLSGAVVTGKGIGRTLGYPTANVAIPELKQLPTHGVYVCVCRVDGRDYRAVVNVGRHPTLPEGDVTVEASLLGTRLALYGKDVTLTFLQFLRPEQRFDSPEALAEQIAQDTAAASAYFDGL